MTNVNLSEKHYKKGAIIWIENSKAMPYFFILKKGLLRLSLKIMNDKDDILLRDGDTFGLVACLTGHDYLNRLIAVKDSNVIMIRKEELIPFLSSKKDIFYKIIKDYSNRLRDINHKLFTLCSKSVYTELPKHLLEIGEYYFKKKMMSHYSYALMKYLEYSDDVYSKEEVQKKIAELHSKHKIETFSPETMGHHVIYNKDEIIFLEQEKGEYFYYIEKGKVKISHIDKDNEFIIAILNEGEIFGEMAILNQTTRNATAIAFEECRLLILHRDTFMNQLGDKILKLIFTSLAKRMWYSHRRALNLSYRNPVTRLYDYLDFVIKSKGVKRKDRFYFFDLLFKDLKVMTNTLEVEENNLKEFINDPNININYGLISIADLEKFNDIYKIYLNKERYS